MILVGLGSCFSSMFLSSEWVLGGGQDFDRGFLIFWFLMVRFGFLYFFGFVRVSRVKGSILYLNVE